MSGQMRRDTLLDTAELAPDTANRTFDDPHCAARQRACLIERALAEFLHLAYRLACELLGLLHNQLDGLDDTTQDLFNGDGDRHSVAKGDRQRRRRKMGRSVRWELAREED